MACGITSAANQLRLQALQGLGLQSLWGSNAFETNPWLLRYQLGCAKLHLGASLCLLLRKDTQ